MSTHACLRPVMALVALTLAALALIACNISGLRPTADEAPDDAQGALTDALPACIPGGEARPMPARASDYAEMCAPHVGVAPAIDCGDGVNVPIHVDGVEVFEDPGDRQCDHHDFKGGCAPGSRVGRLEGVAADGQPMPHVVWVYFCRSQGPEDLAHGIASVQMIGYNRQTGATCFFESPDAVGRDDQIRYLSVDADGFLDGALPGPGDPDFDRAFIAPPAPCVECHQSDPFIHNPWIDGARWPADPREPVIPEVGGDAPYFVVGGAHWDMRTVHIEGNGCLDCHRAPTRIASLFDRGGVHVSGFMPADNPGRLTDDYQALLDCFRDGPERTPGCEHVIPPGGGCEGGVVGADYGPARGSDGKDGDDGVGEGEGKGDDTGDIEERPCPVDLDVTAPCVGAPLETACVRAQRWFWCEGGRWASK